MRPRIESKTGPSLPAGRSSIPMRRLALGCRPGYADSATKPRCTQTAKGLLAVVLEPATAGGGTGGAARRSILIAGVSVTPVSSAQNARTTDVICLGVPTLTGIHAIVLRRASERR